MRKVIFFLFLVVVGVLSYGAAKGEFFHLWEGPGGFVEEMITAEVQPRTFQVQVNTVGELEAARSTVIASAIRGDFGKVIHIAADGITVQPGDILVKMDPSPFEEKVAELNAKLKDQEVLIAILAKTLQWEKQQAILEQKTASFEVSTAELELKKTVNGDGPLELFRLHAAEQKALAKFDELSGYSQDLALMEEQGYLNSSERRQAEKKLKEEEEGYENAKMQYETYRDHVLPMQVKKAETALQKALLRQDEVSKTSRYKLEKAKANLQQSLQAKRELEAQQRGALQELAQCEIQAPAPGMVVLREEYRSGQKRKPRVGDIAVKNQALLDLPDLNSMIVKTKVREVDLYKVAAGKRAIIEVDAYPRVSFLGTVQAIGVLAISDLARSSGEKYFEVKIALENADSRLRPGMTSRVTILADQVDDKLTVPVHALFEIDKATYCYTAVEGGYCARRVKMGSCNEQWAEISDGLVAGDRVCLAQPPQSLLVRED